MASTENDGSAPRIDEQVEDLQVTADDAAQVAGGTMQPGPVKPVTSYVPDPKVNVRLPIEHTGPTQ